MTTWDCLSSRYVTVGVLSSWSLLSLMSTWDFLVCSWKDLLESEFSSVKLSFCDFLGIFSTDSLKIVVLSAMISLLVLGDLSVGVSSLITSTFF